ncbi:MAG: hypothetical protein GXO42_00570 [bacterium]|nr:hypothetical protein [bacterium]
MIIKYWKDAAVLADLHVGIELDTSVLGARLPVLLERYVQVLDQVDTPRLIIVGDLKHEILGAGKYVQRFCSWLAGKFEEVIIVKGNHDGKIEEVVQGCKNVRVVKYWLEDGTLFAHGHQRLPAVQFSRLVLGHIHPAIPLVLEEEITIQEMIKCLLRYEGEPEIEILPAANPLIVGTNVIEFSFDLPPLKQLNVQPEYFTVYAEGVRLGKLQDLKNYVYKT